MCIRDSPITGDISVADGSQLDFEADMTHEVTVELNDGSNTVSKPFLITVNNLYEFATTDLDADNSSGATGTNFLTSFDGSAPVLIADSDAIIIDQDSSTITGIDITITNLPDGPDESLIVDTSAYTNINETYNSSNGLLTISGTGTVAEYEAILKSVEYNNVSTTPDNTCLLYTSDAADE